MQHLGYTRIVVHNLPPENNIVAVVLAYWGIGKVDQLRHWNGSDKMEEDKTPTNAIDTFQKISMLIAAIKDSDITPKKVFG
ncbi:hypothetical protein ACLOJK_013342 [Asimina triloba]